MTHQHGLKLFESTPISLKGTYRLWKNWWDHPTTNVIVIEGTWYLWCTRSTTVANRWKVPYAAYVVVKYGNRIITLRFYLTIDGGCSWSFLSQRYCTCISWPPPPPLRLPVTPLVPVIS